MSIFHGLNLANAAREHAVDELVENLARKGKTHVDDMATFIWTGTGIRTLAEEKIVKRIQARQKELGTDIAFPIGTGETE